MSTDINKQDVIPPVMLPQDEKRYTRLGWLVLIGGIVGFFLWAGFAPLDKGVASPGSVMVTGNRKTVQAPLPGIIKQIDVKEGDVVKAGQVLVQLSQVQAQSQVNSLREQYYTTLASSNRLLAEQEGAKQITFSPELEQQRDNPRIAEIIALQSQLFTSRRLSLQSEVDAYKQSMDGTKSQLKGMQDSRVNRNIQLSSLKEQMNNMKELAKDGYVARNRYLEIQRQYADVSGSIDEITGRIGQAQKQLLESAQRIDQRYADYQREVRTQLAQTQMETGDFKSRLSIANYDLGNTAIVAPVAGTVVGLTVFTQGGVVGGGEPLMEIVPSGAPLEIDARLKVDLVDKVYPGLNVDLMFTAFNQNKTPKIPGEVSLISADRLVEKANGEPYYQMRIKVTPEGMHMLNGLDIKPGMPVEVFVKTGERSLLSYLFKPILDRAHTSLTEE